MSITFFPDLPFHTKPMLNKLYLQLCRLICVAWLFSGSASNHKDTVDGVDVLLHVTCAVLTTGGTMIL